MSAARRTRIGWISWGLATGALVMAFAFTAITSWPHAHADGAPQSAPVAVAAAQTPPVAVVQPAAPTAVQSLLDALLKLVGIAAATAIPLLLRRWLAAKVSTEALEQLTELARQGVEAGEEAAHKQVALGRMKLSGPEKLETACKYVLETSGKLGLVGVSEQMVKQMVESRLGASRT